MFPYMDSVETTPAPWGSATRWIRDIPIRSYDDVATQVAGYLTTEWEFENLTILDWTEPEPDEDAYIVRDVEIRYVWGYTDEFRAEHGVAI